VEHLKEELRGLKAKMDTIERLLNEL